ncbi:NAD(P)/FAD-dependent oxidoreductase [Crocinitomicaceae bacterium CZZ-1]|uniref:NAD(P)/FAD-dependent oxidoreductase n=1 Tax=Taishania pollutisoli TaxID=2766479 RepID=A0A8J6PLE8_9FLAO|nr:NAD(P)/FAD-dependent oxidoreductase [Taishania pollutisoli]MBC9813926.1 NAD(P)/FAD-dependent oxidoreductase [Taishania pollutisoli]MBX2948849.1 NAD(P)/FAD-dependent oxidoreductase [Crocinitomicaceae bacterium]NGF75836.1 NAD(P)/FAD-dependent oxidoreductase [Fluviicola sp. SGL-29]
MNTDSRVVTLDVAVIGGGAAGFFAAIHAKNTTNTVAIFEKSAKLLSKVKISGGGRCNVTNACFDNELLSGYYPRGEKQLRRAFYQFNARSTVEWYESRGVKLKTYPDNCIFPQANDSQVIIDCLLKECYGRGVTLQVQHSVKAIRKENEIFILTLDEQLVYAKKVIVTTGGQPKMSGLKWLEELGLKIVPPVPSLFTFNMPGNPIRELMGNVVEQTTVKIEGTKLTGKGPLLITHWGMSGPAILQLSAWGARILEEKKYRFSIFVNWLDEMKEEALRERLQRHKKEQPEKMLSNANPFSITNKIWQFLLQKYELPAQVRWKELEGKSLNKLITALLFDKYDVSGKTTFKEEFVTAGGVHLSEIDFNTMESKKINGLYFAGEVLDIDGITGGFNFQAAWTTGYIAGKHAGKD